MKQEKCYFTSYNLRLEIIDAKLRTTLRRKG